MAAAIAKPMLRLRRSDRTGADGASTMTISFGGFKSVSVALLAVLWLAAPASASSGGGAMRINPNVNPPIVKPGSLLQEAEDTEAAAVDVEEGDPAAEESAAEESAAEEHAADESAAEESSEAEASDDSGQSEVAEESEEASGE